jgi:hypothetical protein
VLHDLKIYANIGNQKAIFNNDALIIKRIKKNNPKTGVIVEIEDLSSNF